MATQFLTGSEHPITKVPSASPVSFLDLKSQYAAIQNEIIDAVHRVLASQHFILGAEVEKFEAEIAQYVGAKFAVGCGSGSDAILLALMALDIEPDDEVITTSFTSGQQRVQSLVSERVQSLWTFTLRLSISTNGSSRQP